MTTKHNTRVDVGTNGLIKACAYCCSREQLVALNRAYPGTVSHGICPPCFASQAAILDTREAA
jgi:hypothetical protein